MTAQFYEGLGIDYIQTTILNQVDDICLDNFDNLCKLSIQDGEIDYDFLENKLANICISCVDDRIFDWRFQLNLPILSHSGNNLAMLFDEIIDNIFDCYKIYDVIRQQVSEYVEQKKEKNE